MTNPAPLVEQFMTHCPETIQAGATLTDAHEIMRKHGIRHLPVMRGTLLVGLLSLRDLHLIETLKDIDQDRVPVDDAMSERPFTVAPDAHLDAVAAQMAHDRIGSAVVQKDGDVIGIFTTTDALIALLHAWKKDPA